MSKADAYDALQLRQELGKLAEERVEWQDAGRELDSRIADAVKRAKGTVPMEEVASYFARSRTTIYNILGASAGRKSKARAK